MKRTFEAPIYAGVSAYIRPNYIVLKEDYIYFHTRSKRQKEASIKNFKNNSTNPNLSLQSQKKIKQSLNWLVAAAKYKRVFVRKSNKNFFFKINFITLTIPPQSSDIVTYQEFQKCLNTWLSYHRKYNGLTNYVWKVEASEDKRLHIHITADTFIHYNNIKESWNRILQKNELLTEHFRKYKDYNPNSTDVHSVRKVKNLAGYLVEYMCKKTSLPLQFKGRIWSASHSLSQAMKCTASIPAGQESKNLKFIDDNSIKHKPIRKTDALGVEGPTIASLYLVKARHWLTSISGVILSSYRSNIDFLRNYRKTQQKFYFEIEHFSEKTINEFITTSNNKLSSLVTPIKKVTNTINAGFKESWE